MSMMKPYAERSHEKMKDVLMSPDASGPEVHYYMIRGGIERENITVWETGTIDGEYIKAYGHYHIGDISETYHILRGEGILMLQRYKDGEVTSCFAIHAKAGDSLPIPTGIGHLMVNTGKTWLVTADDSPVDFSEKDPVSLPRHADYETVRKMKGFAYYVVEKEGKPKYVKNPTYKNTPEIKEINTEQYLTLMAAKALI